MGIARAWRSDTWLLITILTIAALLFAFGLIAQEVIEGEPLAVLERAEAFAAALACDLERCMIAKAAISRELSEPLDFVTETRPEAHATGT